MRRDVVRIIRQFKPDILVTCDPQNLFPSYGLNHPDHRAVGQAVLEAAYPAAGNELFFPELLIKENLEPHTPKEIWVALTNQPNVALDVTDMWEQKIRALKEHKSQVGNPARLEERLRSRHTQDSTAEKPCYEETFRVVNWREK
jgi:LmbE family N-acetylglucosaminyl deacetylase